MRQLLIILFSFLSFTCFSQTLDSIKHIEVISEVRDSMALINNDDINKINYTFQRLELVDSLNRVNELIINNLTIQNKVLDSILVSQKAIIENDQLIRDQIITNYDYELDYYKEELKKSNRKKVAWQSTTGISILAIVLIIVL